MNKKKIAKAFTETKEFQQYRAQVEAATQRFIDELTSEARNCAHQILLGSFGELASPKDVVKATKKIAKVAKRASKKAAKKVTKQMKRVGKKSKKSKRSSANKAYILRTKMRNSQKLSKGEQRWLAKYDEKNPLIVKAKKAA